MWQELANYLMAVLTNGFGIATGIYGVVELGYLLVAGKEIPKIPRNVRLAIGFVLLICAQFMAWRGERKGWEQEREVRIVAEKESKRLEGVVSGKDETISNFRDQLLARPPQIQFPPIQIEQSYRPIERRILGEDKDKIVNFLGRFPPARLKITSPINDAEASRYATDLMQTFKEAKWDVEDEGIGRTMIMPPFKGIKLLGRLPEFTRSNSVIVLREALILVGLAPIAEYEPKLEHDIPILRVGQKPN